MDRTYWSLYVDESGNLDDPEASVVLAGTAVAVGEDPLFMARLRRAMREAAPLVPWPFHRWMATKAAIYPLWRRLSADPSINDVVDRACDRAMEIWEEKSPHRLSNIIEILRQGGEPSPEQIGNLRKILRVENEQVYQKLRAYSRQVCMEVSQSLGRLAAEEGYRAEALSFFASESSSGDGLESGEGRYFELLLGLLERVRDVIGQYEGEHHVQVHLAWRRARHPHLPASRRRGRAIETPLNRSHIIEACKRIDEVHNIDDDDRAMIRRVRFGVGKIWDYDEDVAPGIVVADSAANLFYRQLIEFGWKDRRDELEMLHDIAESFLQLPLQVKQNAELSNAAAIGAARGAIGAVRKGYSEQAAKLLQAVESRWAGEQAQGWMEYFESLEGEEQR